MAALLLIAEFTLTRQSVDPSDWLLCLYLGIAGLGAGFVVHYSGLAASSAFPRLKVKNHGA
jgi:drug/metabolite transporter (DMT)-like permease